jgi:NADH-quinone oxidoreductase subunit C
MALENTAIQDKLVATLVEAVYNSARKRYFFFECCRSKQSYYSFLKNDPELRFHFNGSVWYHYPDDVEEQFAVVYHLHNWYENKELKLAFLNGEKPEIKTISNIF